MTKVCHHFMNFAKMADMARYVGAALYLNWGLDLTKI